MGVAHAGCGRRTGAWRRRLPQPRFGEPQPFSFDSLRARAKALAAKPYVRAPRTTAYGRQGRLRRHPGDQVPRRPGAMADGPRRLPGTAVPRRSLQSVGRAHQRAVERPGARAALFARLLRLQRRGARRHAAARSRLFRLSRHGRARQGNRLARLPRAPATSAPPARTISTAPRRAASPSTPPCRSRRSFRASSNSGCKSRRRMRRRSPSTRCSTGRASPAPTASRR